MNTRSGSRKRLKKEEEEWKKPDDSTINNNVQFIACNDEPFTNNPMMNDLILDNLFKLVDPRELSRVRKVSKQWYNVSLPVWLKNGPPIAITNDWLFERFVSKGHAAGINDRHHNWKVSSQSGSSGTRRFPKFHLEMDNYEIRVHDLFWELHGEWLTHLTINYVEIPGVVRLLNILTCKFTPKLEYLEVECRHHSLFRSAEQRADEPRELPMAVVGAQNRNLKEFRVDYHERPPLPMNWKNLLSHYPKLEHLLVGKEISGRRRTGGLLQIEAILAAIKEIRSEDKDKLNLKSLIWCYNMSYREVYSRRGLDEVTHHHSHSPSVPEAYRQASLSRLQTFRIDFGSGDSDALINNILSTFASSLRKLEFYRLPPLQHLPFRNMEQLQFLTLTGYPIKNLLFLSQLPALRSLSLWGDRSLWRGCDYTRSIISATSTPGLTFPSLTQFRIGYKIGWSDADLRGMRELMPNLTELELELNNSTFRLVCQLWPRLEHLCAEYRVSGTIGDAGIVGLVKTGREIQYNQPNITSLTELKSFAIDNLGDRIRLFKREFSEHSVLAGFGNLAHLEGLTIKTYSMSPALKKLILRKFPFAKIK